jgi:DNA invertase Pin-like site-specific DNA recombinase
VSTTTHQSVEMQLRDLRELANRRGLEIVEEYCDEGVSGSKDSRPGLNRLLADAEVGKFSVVLVWKLDRLGRSLIHLVRLMENFQRFGIELVSFSEGLDFTTTTGKLLYQIISAFAEFERDCIRERVRAGMRNAKAKGKRIGRPLARGYPRRREKISRWHTSEAREAYAGWPLGTARRRGLCSVVLPAIEAPWQELPDCYRRTVASFAVCLRFLF